MVKFYIWRRAILTPLSHDGADIIGVVDGAVELHHTYNPSTAEVTVTWLALVDEDSVSELIRQGHRVAFRG